jgi:hypothetical protein
MTTTMMNARPPRKNLASQLDRLDLILDGLADGLNEAVATAVKEAVTVAVEAAIKELLSSAELRKRLQAGQAQPGIARRAARVLCRGVVNLANGLWAGLAWMVGQGRQAGASVAQYVRHGKAEALHRVRRGMTALARQAWLGLVAGVTLARRFRKPLLIALAAGTLVGVGCYCAGPVTSSVLNGVAGFVGSLAATTWARLRRLFTGNSLGGWCGRLLS